MAMSLSKFFRLLLRPLFVLLVSAPIVLLVLSVQMHPTVESHEPLTLTEVSRIEQILLESAPQSPSSQSIQELQLSADQLNLLLRYGVDMMSLSPGWAAATSLQDDFLSAKVSVNLLQGRIPLYLNLDGEFSSEQDKLTLIGLSVGKLQLPDTLLAWSLDRLRENLEGQSDVYQDFNELLTNVENVALSEQGLDITLRWDPVLIGRITQQAQQLFISEQDQQRIIDHYQHIREVAATIPADLRAVSLNTFLVPLFAAAHVKSLNGSDPIAENRTLFQTLAIYVNNEDISQLLGAELAQEIEAAKFIEVRLQRRQDLAQHLVSIAAISSSAGADIAQLLSTTKEAYDARYRSGFSFSDLTANSVGVALASLSTESAESALQMQERMSRLEGESDYMPEVGSNRDGISESDFNAIYSDRNSLEYRQRLREINELITSRPLFMEMEADLDSPLRAQ